MNLLLDTHVLLWAAGGLFRLSGANTGRGRLPVGRFRVDALGVVENFPIIEGREQLPFSESMAGLILFLPLRIGHEGFHEKDAPGLETVPDLGEKRAIQIEKAEDRIETIHRQREYIQIGNDQLEPQASVQGSLTQCPDGMFRDIDPEYRSSPGSQVQGVASKSHA